jgi:hypothetical protein
MSSTPSVDPVRAQTYGGLRPTGRQSRDPAAVIVELESEDGFAHLGIAFEAGFRGHPVLDLNVRLVLPFLEFPMVAGLTDLAWYDLSSSVFVYPTGTVWLLHEVLRIWHDEGRKLGVRAALELMLLTTEITREGGATGGLQGCYSHGNLNPWRIALRDDGTVQVVGYGLPQAEIARRRADPKYALTAESLRYCPPERLLGQPEDAAADSLSLALVACEMMTGKPLYQAPAISDVEKMVSLSEGTAILAKPPADIPMPVAELLVRALVYDPETRLSGHELIGEIEALLKTAKGASLAEVMADTAKRKPQADRPRKKLLAATGTSVFDRSSLAKMADEDDDDEAAPTAKPARSDSRWGSPARRSAEPPAEPKPAPAPAPPPEAQEGRRLRRDGDGPTLEVRRRLHTEAEPAPPAAAPAPPAPEPTPAPAPAAPAAEEGEPRRRLRRITDAPSPAEPTPEPAAAEAPAEGVRRRLLRREDAAPAPEGGEPQVRRRLRREGDPP